MNNRFTNTNYDIRNRAFHFNDRTVNFYHIHCISLQASVSRYLPFARVLTIFGGTACYTDQHANMYTYTYTYTYIYISILLRTTLGMPVASQDRAS